ncbi:hypothetical protein C7I55_12865 [Sphingomonas deserti]|uniref:Uncharacterized protein n=1 Tax=Allosphingosinicella deserti TaxID=2116704 RepID=A0A2P7QNE5_9SPHN|nr:hypothetical protein C7I55_12865 [Sphingomonas deserti]
MWVYGDHERAVTRAALLEEVRAAAAVLDSAEPGLTWHSACVALFLSLSELLQGIADEALRETGVDAPSPAQDAVTAASIAAATAIDRSWRSAFEDQQVPDLATLSALDENGALTLRRCEGYAFYAVYPELYLEAARALPPGALVIGLRSIGGGLAALAAAASKAKAVLTVRPGGAFFDRRIAAGPALESRIAESGDAPVAIVDEGPGLSGSSFGGTADWLEEQGVAPDRILFMPSHAGDLGPQAREDHRTRWNARPRLVAAFDDVLLAGPMPLARWFEDLTGPATEPLDDLSGGAWRTRSPWHDAPADPGRESRKYLLQTDQGRFLLKFVGLDALSTAKFGRARRLFEAGFAPEPLALRHGFLLERWVHGRQVTPPVSCLAAYLSFRASHFPAETSGAPLRQLVDMARHNLREGLGEEATGLLDPWTDDRVEALQPAVQPVHVDARLHRWEWLETPQGVLKTDAVDHAQAHDLIGCQDIAWDIAGAAIEFDLAPEEIIRLAEAVMSSRPVALIDLLLACYLAFQLGWWTFAGEAGVSQRDVYARKIGQRLRDASSSRNA